MAISMTMYEEILHEVLNQFYPGQWGTILPGFATWVSDGTFGAVFGGYGNDGNPAIRVGMGILNGLSVSSELLNEIARVNCTMGAGHFWLTEGEEGNWQLFWGHSMMKEYLEFQFAIDFLIQVTRALPIIYSRFGELFQSKFGGELWWRDEPEMTGAQALALLTLTM